MIRPSHLDLRSKLAEASPTQRVPPRILLLRAPAGYGKTGTIAEWLGTIDDATVSVRWAHCTPEQPESIWAAIAAALADLSAEAGPETNPAGSTAEFKSSALRLGAHLPRAAILVIDDYHHATNPENDLALVELGEASPLLTLGIAGRRVQLLDGPLLAARAPMRIFGPRDFSYTPDEALDMAAQLGIAESASLRTALHHTKGWPLAVRAVLEPSAAETGAGGATAHAQADPLSNLTRFTLHHLEIIDDLARRILLAAAQLDAISLDQVAEFTGAEFAQARAATYRLLELGLLVTVNTGDRTDFRCHRSVRTALRARSERSNSPEQRHALYLGRARRIADSDPLASFKLLCAVGALTEAEEVLERYFAVITGNETECIRTLRVLPEQSLMEHPSLAAARLFLEMPDPSMPPATLARITGLWRTGVQQQLDHFRKQRGAEAPLPLLVQGMVAARLLGEIDAANSTMRELEARLESGSAGTSPGYLISADAMRPSALTGAPLTPCAQANANGALFMYYREIASTALMSGDYPRARRAWGRLHSHAEALVAKGDALSHDSAVSLEIGQRWLLAALHELALTEALDGDMRRSAGYLAEAETFATATGATPPGISWVSGELARAYLSCEQQDPAMLALAIERTKPLSDRIEQWPLLLIAEARSLRYLRGADWALSQLRAGLHRSSVDRHTSGRWHDCLTSYQAMLQTVLGGFSSADALISALPDGSAIEKIESARRALFAGDDVTALLIAQSVGDPETTQRQRLDRCLIITAAAWGCGQTDEALNALRNAAEALHDYSMTSPLWGVPFDALREAAVAAREAGIVDIVDIVDAIDAVPEPARSSRYERLTDMELRTLTAIATHHTTNQAATALFITPGTVKKHLASVYRKLHAKGRDEAVLQATRMGLLPRTSAAVPAGGGAKR